jgi:uncharacterized protein (UPF0248 family)
MITANPTDDEALINQIMDRLKWTVADEKVRMRIRIEAELERTYYKDLRAKDEIIKQKDEIIQQEKEILKQKQQELANLRLQAAQLARQQAEMTAMREQMALLMQQLSKK